MRALLPVAAQPSWLAVLAAGGGASLDGEHLEPLLVDLAASWWPPWRALNASVRADGSRAVRRLLDWLGQQPGEGHEPDRIRCDFLQVQPAAGDQPRTIKSNLNERIKQAKKQAWLGDVVQLRVTLNRLHDKQNRLHDLLDSPPSPQPALTRQ